MSAETNSKEIQELILAEINELLAKERENIVRRAHKKLREKRGGSGS